MSKGCERGWCLKNDTISYPLSNLNKFDCQMPFDTTRSFFNVDIGLYRKFEIVEEEFGQGRPTGCDGLNRADWMDNKRHRNGDEWNTSKVLDFNPESKNSVAENRLSDVIAGKPFSGCSLNDDVVGQEIMHEIIEEFANNNQIWVNEFVAAFQKMLENGYQAQNNPNNALEELNGISWADLYMRCENKEKCGGNHVAATTKHNFNCDFEPYPGNI